MNLFTQFVIGDKHVTYDFNPGKCKFPKGIKENDDVRFIKVGEYSDLDIDCDIVVLVRRTGFISRQPNGTLLHVTTATRNGVKPVEAGKRATKNEDRIIDVKPITLNSKAAYFAVKG